MVSCFWAHRQTAALAGEGCGPPQSPALPRLQCARLGGGPSGQQGRAQACEYLTFWVSGSPQLVVREGVSQSR